MDEIKIGENIEKRLDQEQQHQLDQALQEPTKPSAKTPILLIILLAIIIALSFGGFKAFNYFTGANIIDLDSLHELNRQGKLAEDRGYLYNGYSFVYFDGLWWAEINQGALILKVPLHFSPREVEHIPIIGDLDPNFNQGQEVYLAIDPEFANKYYTLSLSELNFNVVKGVKRKPVAACTETNSICEDRPILSCNNTKNLPVIELQHQGEPQITFQDTCIKITGEEYELVKAANRLIWKWYGVMD